MESEIRKQIETLFDTARCELRRAREVSASFDVVSSATADVGDQVTGDVMANLRARLESERQAHHELKQRFAILDFKNQAVGEALDAVITANRLTLTYWRREMDDHS